MAYPCNIKSSRNLKKWYKVILIIYFRTGHDYKPTTYGLENQKWTNTYHQYQGKGRGEYCLNLKKKENRKLVNNYYSRWTRAHQYAESKQRKSEEEEMHLPKPGNWPTISENWLSF